jgi:hypothetical protein
VTLDIEAIRRNAISPGLHTEANSVYWWKTSQALLDAYEAAEARADAAVADKTRAEAARKHDYQTGLTWMDQALAAEAKIQAISDEISNPRKIGYGIIRRIINSAALPEETPTEPPEPKPRPQVTDLMAALEASLIRATAPPERPEETQP